MPRAARAATGISSWTGAHRSRYGAAVRHLKSSDPVMAKVVEAVGPCRFGVRAEGTHLEAIVRAITYQQLSGKAAATIHGRLRALVPGPEITAAALNRLADEQLRGAGLSRQKIGYLRDLARRAASKEVPFDRLDQLPDAEVIEALSLVKGVGLWTAQMFLMFRLGRTDVLATGDLGIQNAIRRAYRMRKQPTARQIERLGAAWSPHSTLACWYLWRSLEIPQ